MKALVFAEKNLRFEPRFPDLEAGAGVGKSVGEAVIRPLRMGICSTDLEICRGYLDFSGVLGHEFVGVVERVDGVDERKLVGKRVVGGINAVCGECEMCRRGLATHCRVRTVLGIAGRDGCFAEAFRLPAINLVVVPDQVSDDEAVFAEPLAAAIQATQQVQVEGKPYITILGDGRLGLLCAQVFAPLNAGVRLVGKHEAKMNLCEKWGIAHRHVDAVGRRADQDVVVDCTGSASGLELAMQMVRPRGKIILKTTVAAGGAGGAAAIDLSPIVIHEIEIIGSRCGNMNQAVNLLAERKVDVLSLISRRFKLADGVKAFQAARSGEVIKVLLEV